MSGDSLADTLIKLGMITPEQRDQLESVLHQFEDYRFEDLAVETGVVTDEQIARAIAARYGLQLVPDERLSQLQVTEQALSLLPPELIRARLILPSFFDERRKLLSVLVADPTDVHALREAQAITGADRLRLFIGGRSAIRALIERLLPDGGQEPMTLQMDRPPPEAAPTIEVAPDRAIVLDPDLSRLSLLRSLDQIEGTRSEMVADPEQIAAMLSQGFDRIYHREALRGEVETWLPRWRRIRPDLQIAPLPGYGPSWGPAVPARASQQFLLRLVEFLLLASESRSMDTRAMVRRALRVTKRVSAELELPPDRADALTLAVTFLFLDQLSVVSGFVGDETVQRTDGRRFELALAVLEPLESPYEIEELLLALEGRLIGGEIGEDISVEALYTIKAWAESGGWDLARLERSKHHPMAITALDRALRRERLLGQINLQSGGTSTILIAERDASLVTALETRLAQTGFELVTVANGAEALERARDLRPLAVIVNQRLPKRDGLSVLLELKRDAKTLDIPVFLITNHSDARDVARGLELGAEEVLEKPLNLQVLLVRLRRAIARSGRVRQSGVAGRLSDLSLTDLLQSLSLSQKTAEVRLTCPNGSGALYLKDGRLVHASFGERRGEEAFYLLAFEPDGTFDIQFDGSTPSANIDATTDSVLLEAMRLLDEKRRSDEQG